MRSYTPHTVGQNGALALAGEGTGGKKNARKPYINGHSLLPISFWSIGNEVPHAYFTLSTRNEHSPDVLAVQNQALSKMLVDYEKQIEQFKLTLGSVRRSLLELYQHVLLAAPSTHASMGSLNVRELRTIVSSLLKKACTETAALHTPKPIIATCKILRTAYPQLTRSESKVAAYIVCGFATADIALASSLSERTVENHRFHIRQKLAVNPKKNLRLFLQGSFGRTP